MVGNMIRVLRARMTLLAVDEAGMSTVEYSTVYFYTPLLVPLMRTPSRESRATCRPVLSHPRRTVKSAGAGDRERTARDRFAMPSCLKVRSTQP